MASTHSHRVPVGVPRLATAIILAMTLANAAQPANAVSGYLTAFETQYPDAVGSRIDTCNVCHTDIPALNPYGVAFQGAGHEFAPIESDDSDGDGASNLAEIMALTFPGDPGDTPPEPSPTATPSPTSTETPLSEATPTNTEQTGDTPTATPTGSPVQVPTNTSVSATVTPTTSSASPTTAVNTPTLTPGGSTTVSPTRSAARTPTRGGSGLGGGDDDSCSIVAPERSSTGRGFLLLLAPALLLWASRRRL